MYDSLSYQLNQIAHSTFLFLEHVAFMYIKV